MFRSSTGSLRIEVALQLFWDQYGMSEAISGYSVEERMIQGETVWVAIRARGAEWSWLTPAEAARLGRQWVEKYGTREVGASPQLIAAE
jgi:hypothetical protein